MGLGLKVREKRLLSCLNQDRKRTAGIWNPDKYTAGRTSNLVADNGI